MKSHTAISAIFLALGPPPSTPAQATEAKEEPPAVAAAAPAEKGAMASTPQASASAPVAKKHAAQDRSKHYHPRDGK